MALASRLSSAAVATSPTLSRVRLQSIGCNRPDQESYRDWFARDCGNNDRNDPQQECVTWAPQQFGSNACRFAPKQDCKQNAVKQTEDGSSDDCCVPGQRQCDAGQGVGDCADQRALQELRAASNGYTDLAFSVAVFIRRLPLLDVWTMSRGPQRKPQDSEIPANRPLHRIRAQSRHFSSLSRPPLRLPAMGCRFKCTSRQTG
jgi:hypothetical protein